MKRTGDREAGKINIFAENRITADELSQLSTAQAAQMVLNDTQLGIDIIAKVFLEVENQQYRKGEDPEVVAKLLALIAPNGASAKDFNGQLIRTKESPEELAQMVKISEIDELAHEISRWFEGKMEDDTFITICEAIESYTDLLVLASSQSLDGLDFERHSRVIKRLQKEKEAAMNAPFELIAEIVDLHYNLLQLLKIDPEGTKVYTYWINQINLILKWKPNEAFALVVSKYHRRIFGSNGANDFEGEYSEIAKLVNRPDEFDENKLPFPDNLQLVQLFELVNRMRRTRPIQQDPNEISLMRHYIHLQYEHDAEKRMQDQINGNPENLKYLLVG